MPIAQDPTETWEYQLREDRKRVEIPHDEAFDEKDRFISNDGTEKEPHWVRLKIDPEATFYELGHMTAREESDILDGMATVGHLQDGEIQDVALAVGGRVRKILYAGLRGWRQLRKRDGEEVTFRIGSTKGSLRRCHPSNLDYIYSDQRDELSNEIVAGNRVTALEGN